MIWRYLLTGSDYIPNWTPERAQKAERETLAGLGYVVEPHYGWSRKFRPQPKRQPSSQPFTATGRVAQFGGRR